MFLLSFGTNKLGISIFDAKIVGGSYNRSHCIKNVAYIYPFINIRKGLY